MIKIKNLCKKYEAATPLKNINAIINDGEIISIIGPSGTGKSTFIRCLNLLEKPTSGEIYYDDVCISDPTYNPVDIRKQTAMVFQSFNLFENLNVVENVMAALVDLKNIDNQDAYDLAMKQLEDVGMADKAYRFPSELSGGQKQRVAIARALATKPKVLFMDEPTSALDPTMVDEVLNVIKKIINKQMTVIIVTHEIKFAKEISDRVFYMDEGIIYEEGTSEEIFEHPNKTKTKAFVSGLKTIKVEFTDNSFTYGEVRKQISNYLAQYKVDRNLAYHLDIIIDELIINGLVKKYKKARFNIGVFNDDELEIDAAYHDDDDYDIMNELDIVSKKMVDSYSKDYTHSYNGRINVIRFKVV